jgi:hypothetical protein
VHELQPGVRTGRLWCRSRKWACTLQVGKRPIPRRCSCWACRRW